jgi:hypothetical protein
MELSVQAGDKIRYTSAAGTRVAQVRNVSINPTSRTGYSIAWLSLFVPAQNGAKFDTNVTIPADAGSLKAFKVEKMA